MNSDDVLNILRTVEDPDLHRDIVNLGFIKNLQIQNNSVSFDLQLTTPACPMKDRMKQECETKLRALPGIKEININLTASVSGRADFSRSNILPGVKNILAVASGKGGVGKSTVASNLVLALSHQGASTGLLDCDIYGPSIPTMFGLLDQQPEVTPDEKILPLSAHGIKIMSIGFLASSQAPVIWRGPMVHNILLQFLTKVHWGELDYLILDLPPGTGDAQLTLTQSASLSGAVIVTTPQEVSLVDARKGLKMFERVNVPVLGLIENMSYFKCSGCGKVADIFRRGGGEKLSKELKVPFLGEIPIIPAISEAGDQGLPIVAREPESAAAKIYLQIAGAMAAQLSIVRMKADSESPQVDFQWKK